MKLSDQQYQIIDVLWALGSGTARDIQKHAEDLNLAHTTVGTILTRLEKKGILTSELKGRERLFTPLVQRHDVQRSMISSLVQTVFQGDTKDLLAHLVQENDFSESDLEELRGFLNHDKRGDK